MSSAPLCALSTMWSQGRFRDDGQEADDMAAFAATVAGLGFRHVEINYVVPPDGVRTLLETAQIGVASIHSPCPRVKGPDGRLSDALNLASDDPDERELAVELAKGSIDLASEAGARYVVVHLGGIGGGIFPEERELRRLYDEGERDGERVDGLRASAAQRRRDGQPLYFPHARRSLDEIADHAARHGIAIGLENRYHYHEFPNIDEMHELLDAYPPETVGFWIDLGHAEVLDRLGLVPHRRYLDELAERCIGSHVHDTDGLADHRAPGNGTADWPHYAEKLPPHVPRVFEINQRQTPDDVANAIPFLQRVGILPAPVDSSRPA